MTNEATRITNKRFALAALGYSQHGETEQLVIERQLDQAHKSARGEGAIGAQAWRAAHRQVEIDRRGAEEGRPTVALQIARGEVQLQKLRGEFDRTGDLGILQGLSDTELNLRVLRGEQKSRSKAEEKTKKWD